MEVEEGFSDVGKKKQTTNRFFLYATFHLKDVLSFSGDKTGFLSFRKRFQGKKKNVMAVVVLRETCDIFSGSGAEVLPKSGRFNWKRWKRQSKPDNLSLFVVMDLTRGTRVLKCHGHRRGISSMPIFASSRHIWDVSLRGCGSRVKLSPVQIIHDFPSPCGWSPSGPVWIFPARDTPYNTESSRIIELIIVPPSLRAHPSVFFQLEIDKVRNYFHLAERDVTFHSWLEKKGNPARWLLIL